MSVFQDLEDSDLPTKTLLLSTKHCYLGCSPFAEYQTTYPPQPSRGPEEQCGEEQIKFDWAAVKLSLNLRGMLFKTDPPTLLYGGRLKKTIALLRIAKDPVIIETHIAIKATKSIERAGSLQDLVGNLS